MLHEPNFRENIFGKQQITTFVILLYKSYFL